MKRFIEGESRTQSTLLPAVLDDYIAEANPVRVVDVFVDELNQQINRELLTYMISDPTTITRAIRVTAVAKCLERIADHATNVAEMVIFMVKGKDIRHTS